MKKYFEIERLLGLLLVIVTLAIYFKVFFFAFVNFDDGQYVSINDHIQTGFTWDNLNWAFTEFYSANWHPLTWLSHMLDFSCYGLNPAGHHLTNVFFHVASSLMLFLFFKEATGHIWRSFVIAALFALHPLHVESVAWISERKDVLSAFFWVLTMLLYLRYTRNRSPVNYSVTLLAFILGLLSKPMVVTLPFVLLLLDFWPLGRIADFSKDVKTVVIEKIPFFLLSAASCVITFIAQSRSGAVAPLELMPLKARILNSILAYTSYLEKIFWPVNLSALYPHPVLNVSTLHVFISFIFIVLVSLYAFYISRRKGYLFVGWFWFIGTLVPVIGLVQVGAQSMADRYTYLPSIGVFLIFAVAISEIRVKSLRYGANVIAASLIIILSVVTWNQIDYWENTGTLFKHASKVTANNCIALSNYGQHLAMEGKFDEAIEQCMKSLKILPNFAEGHSTLGMIYSLKNMNSEAIEEYKEALRIKPNVSSTEINLGRVFVKTGQRREAVQLFTSAEKNMEKSSWGYNALGMAWTELEEYDISLKYFETALKLRPDAAETLNNIGRVYVLRNDPANARMFLEKALVISPNNPEILNNYGLTLSLEGKYEDAVYSYLMALRLRPEYEKARENFYKAVLALSKEVNK